MSGRREAPAAARFHSLALPSPDALSPQVVASRAANTCGRASLLRSYPAPSSPRSGFGRPSQIQANGAAAPNIRPLPPPALC